jgi:hypothetical protein
VQNARLATTDEKLPAFFGLRRLIAALTGPWQPQSGDQSPLSKAAPRGLPYWCYRLDKSLFFFFKADNLLSFRTFAR